MALKEKLAALKEGAKERIPAEARAVMHQATEDLQNSGILEGVIDRGDTLPGFALPNTAGETVRSSDLLDRGPLVLTVYRGVW